MIVDEYYNKDTSGRNRLYVNAKCPVCSIEYTRQKRQLNSLLTCGPSCTNVLKGSAVIASCAHCENKIRKSKSDIAASKSGLVFCNRECKEAGQKYIKEIQPEHYNTGSGVSSYRKKALDSYAHMCVECGFSNIKALQVHHIDKNRDNNALENLEILCANCHLIKHLGH